MKPTGFFMSALMKIIKLFFGNRLFFVSPAQSGQVIKEKKSGCGNCVVCRCKSSARPTGPLVISVTRAERRKMKKAAGQLLRVYGMPDNKEFLSRLSSLAVELLPKRISDELSSLAADFSFTQYGAVVFKGLVDVDQKALGDTPENYRLVDRSKILLYEFISVLMHGAVRGHIIMQQQQREGLKGGIVHSIIPAVGKEETQTSEGQVELAVHTEDSNLYSAARFLSMLYLRNFEEAPSSFYSIRSHDLSKPYIKELFKKIFRFPLDDNYSLEEKHQFDAQESVLYGNPGLPWLRFDPVEQLKMTAEQSPEAQKALSMFWNDVKPLINSFFIPAAGDFVMANNLMVCHGRGSFEAGVVNVNGVKQRCPARWMLRTMSAGSAIDNFAFAHATTAHLNPEKHFGKR